MLAATLLASAALAAAPFPETIPVPAGSQPEGVASGKGTTLYAGSRLDGSVYRADARTGNARLIEAPLVQQGDGILLAGPLLFVVQNRQNKVAVLLLDHKLRRGVLLRELTDPDFDVPTTIARIGFKLYAVNARFNTPPEPDTPYDIVKVG